MGKEYAAKSFKSGNSVALRLPAALGVEPDGEWTVVEDGDKLIFSRKPKAKRKFNIEKVWGCGRHLNLKLLTPGDRLFEERDLLWPVPEVAPEKDDQGSSGS